MKKVFIGLSILGLLVATTYYFTPKNKSLNYITSINCPYTALSRFMISPIKWQQWWPGKKIAGKNYSYKDYNYRIDKILLNGFEATVFNSKDSVKGIVRITPENNNIVSLQWNSLNTSSSFKYNIQSLITDVKKFFDNEKNIYGFTASVEKVTDEFLVSVKKDFNHCPTMDEAYTIINSIKAYVNSKGGKEKNPPMLNVYKETNNLYHTMIAIPTTTAIEGQGKFLYKQMVLGNILVAEITGGINTVKKAEDELNNYIADYQKTSPAIPYQSLITNRIEESDTTKWKTKLYFPVYY